MESHVSIMGQIWINLKFFVYLKSLWRCFKCSCCFYIFGLLLESVALTAHNIRIYIVQIWDQSNLGGTIHSTQAWHFSCWRHSPLIFLSTLFSCSKKQQWGEKSPKVTPCYQHAGTDGQTSRWEVLLVKMEKVEYLIMKFCLMLVKLGNKYSLVYISEDWLPR